MPHSRLLGVSPLRMLLLTSSIFIHQSPIDRALEPINVKHFFPKHELSTEDDGEPDSWYHHTSQTNCGSWSTSASANSGSTVNIFMGWQPLPLTMYGLSAPIIIIKANPRKWVRLHIFTMCLPSILPF